MPPTFWTSVIRYIAVAGAICPLLMAVVWSLIALLASIGKTAHGTNLPVLLLGAATNAAVGSVGGAMLASVWASLLSLVAKFVVGENNERALLYSASGFVGGLTGFLVTLPFVNDDSILQIPSIVPLGHLTWRNLRIFVLVGIAVVGGQLAAQLSAKKSLLQASTSSTNSSDSLSGLISKGMVVRFVATLALLVLLERLLYPRGPSLYFILIYLALQCSMLAASLNYDGKGKF